LTQPDKIFPGQILQVPNSEAVPPRFLLGAELKSTLNRIQVNSGRWKYIVIHHSGSPWDTPKSMDRYHRNFRHMENGLAYHFVIGNGKNTRDGKIYIGDRWREQLQGGHLARASLNEKSIGICLVGNFMRHEPSNSQLNSLRNLLVYLMQECGLDKSAVKSHQDINPKPTACPGRQFPMSRVLAGLP
jgi:N-acetyl-anhydromuramyl-L-alanine amidase AmpD